MLYICLVCLSSFHVFHRICLYTKLCIKNNSFQVYQCLFHHHYLQQVSAISCYFQLTSSGFSPWWEVGMCGDILFVQIKRVWRSETWRSKPQPHLPCQLPSWKEREFHFLLPIILSPPSHLTSCLSVKTSRPLWLASGKVHPLTFRHTLFVQTRYHHSCVKTVSCFTFASYPVV